MTLRFKLPPGDVPPSAAARHMGLTPEAFERALPQLRERGFPLPDPTTGNFDIDAIVAWRRSRHPQFFGPALTAATGARDAKDVVRDRVARLRGG